MFPPPSNPMASPNPHPPVKKFRAGGTPPAPPPPPRAGPPPPPAQGASNPPPTGSTFTMKADDAMSGRRAELLRLHEKMAASKPAPPPGTATSPGAAKPSTEALLNRARAQLPPPPPQQQFSGAPHPAPAQGRSAAPTGPPPPMMPAADLNHFRRTSDIFPEVTSKADPARYVPPLPATTPAGMTMMVPPSLHGVTPAVPRNLDPSFAHNGPPTTSNGPIPPSPPLPTTTATAAAASRSKSVPPPQRRPPPPTDASHPPIVPKSPGGGTLTEEPRRNNRPPPPGRPKATPLEPLRPEPVGAPPATAAAPPRKGPPPPQHAKPPSLVEELSPGARKSSVFLPASAPASMTIPNGVDHLGKGSSHSHASDKSQEPPDSRASVDESSVTQPTDRRAAGPPPTSIRGSASNMPPPPVSPIKSNPTLPPNKGIPPARVPSLMVDTRSGPEATNPFFPGVGSAGPTTDSPTQARSVVPDRQVYPPSASSVLLQAEQYLAASTSSGAALDLGLDDDAGLMEGAKTPPINNRSSVELRMQSELAQLQKDKAYALRRVVELEEELQERQNQQAQGIGDVGTGVDASRVLQTILQLAETQGEGAALDWAHDQLGKNGSGSMGMAPLPSHPPVLPRPKRGPSAADLPLEALRSAAEHVEHEYVADCATFIVRRPYGLAEERELWFKTGLMPAKKYAEAASVLQVPTIEVAAIIRADESLLSVSGPLVRHEMNGQWHDFGDAPGKGESLGIVSIHDESTGEDFRYSLDEVYEGAVAVREQYCFSVLNSAAGIHAGTKGLPKDKEATKPVSEQAKTEASPSPAAQGDSAVTFGALLSVLWSGLLSLLFNCFVVFPLQVFSLTLASLVAVVLLSILWLYIADEDAMGRSAYWHNAPGIM